MRSVAVAPAVLFLIAATGCGGGHKSSGSIPVKTIHQPGHTETVLMPSSSMEPTLHCAQPGYGCEAVQGDRIVVQEPARVLKRGEIVVFKAPPLARARCGAGGSFVKRLIGLPGETWSERNGYVYINGKELNEPYIKPKRRNTETKEPVKITVERYFMMGDNRQSSCDSRVWGPVAEKDVIGTVVEIQRPG